MSDIIVPPDPPEPPPIIEQPPPVPTDPGTTVPTPPHQPPNSSLFPQAHPIVEHPWQPTPVIPTDVPISPVPPVVALPADPPTVVDEPYLSQNENLLTCTMGNWTNEPFGYTYQWRKHGTNTSLALGNTYAVLEVDAGETFTCDVTATNAAGASAPATSNGVVASFTPPTVRS